MASEVKLPRLGQGMEAGTIVKWLKREGDRVEKGEPLFEVDTEKVTQEVEAEASGVLLKIAVSEGEVPVGTTIAFIGSPDEAISVAGAPEMVRKELVEAASAPSRIAERVPVAAAPNLHAAEGRVKASPLARRIARERGVDLRALAGTGPEGRIVAEDVERAVSAPAPAAPPTVEAPSPVEVVVEQLTPTRKTIARRLMQAWEAPVFQITMSAEMTRTKELQARLVESVQEGEAKPTVTDVLTRVCAAALMQHRHVNALFRENALELHPQANIGIAVATERGLVVPVVRGCERKSIAEIAADRTALVGRARARKLEAVDLEGGTFTISNLGMYGVEQFIAVLNPPQTAILAVGAIEERPVARGGELVARPLMTMTLTCDHRAIDGAIAAEFLQTVKAMLEEPGLAL